MQFDPGKGSGCKASYAQKYDPDPRGIDKKQVSVASTILISVHRNCCCSINRCSTAPACVGHVRPTSLITNRTISTVEEREGERNMRISSRCVLPSFEDPCISFSFLFFFLLSDRISLLKTRYRVFFSPPLLASRRTTTSRDNLRNTV